MGMLANPKLGKALKKFRVLLMIFLQGLDNALSLGDKVGEKERVTLLSPGKGCPSSTGWQKISDNPEFLMNRYFIISIDCKVHDVY